jgi:hypothetical protein
VPEGRRICTSHSERLNGSIRNFCKRMGRLTYCFSKKWANHWAAPGLFFMHYNYCRKHSSLKGHTPAMAHGLATEVWSVRKMLEMILAKAGVWHAMDSRDSRSGVRASAFRRGRGDN